MYNYSIFNCNNLKLNIIILLRIKIEISLLINILV